MTPSLRTVWNKIDQKGLLWALRRSKNRLATIFGRPLREIQKYRAIKAARFAALQPRKAKHVVFVCDQVRIRAIKMAYALQEIEWKVTLLHRESISIDVAQYFWETRQFKNPWNALLIAADYFPIVYHVFSNWNFDVASIFIRYKPGKIVFDNNDLLTGMIKEDILKRYPGQTELEKYCYINADGLCCRDLAVQFLRKKLGYNLPPRLLFLEYCWPEGKFVKSPKLKDGTHVVYVGSIETDVESVYAFEYELAAALSRNNVHFDIYPSFEHVGTEIKANMKRFVEPEVFNKYVHIHNTISPLSIVQEISKYHYGLIISSNVVDFPIDGNSHFQHKSGYTSSAKIFDYLDAGLFTFTHNARLPRFILTRSKNKNGAVVTSLDDIAQRSKYEPPQNNVVPKSLLLEGNINRLTKFYLSL